MIVSSAAISKSFQSLYTPNNVVVILSDSILAAANSHTSCTLWAEAPTPAALSSSFSLTYIDSYTFSMAISAVVWY